MKDWSETALTWCVVVIATVMAVVVIMADLAWTMISWLIQRYGFICVITISTSYVLQLSVLQTVFLGFFLCAIVREL